MGLLTKFDLPHKWQIWKYIFLPEYFLAWNHRCLFRYSLQIRPPKVSNSMFLANTAPKLVSVLKQIDHYLIRWWVIIKVWFTYSVIYESNGLCVQTISSVWLAGCRYTSDMIDSLPPPHHHPFPLTQTSATLWASNGFSDSKGYWTGRSWMV